MNNQIVTLLLQNNSKGNTLKDLIPRWIKYWEETYEPHSNDNISLEEYIADCVEAIVEHNLKLYIKNDIISVEFGKKWDSYKKYEQYKKIKE